jgi:PAS domain S-box-containing protein
VRIVKCEYRCSPKSTSKFDNLEKPHIQKSEEFGIHYIIEGDGFFRINGKRFPLQHDSVFVTFPNDSYSFLLPRLDSAFTCYVLSLQLEESDSLVRDLLKTDIYTKQAFYPKRYMRSVFDEVTRYHASGSRYLAEAAIHFVISILYSLHEVEQEPSTTALAVEHIEKAIDWMHENIHEHVTLKELCSQLYLTEAHFIRLFRENQGIPPMKYFTRLKIDAAANLLLETTTPIYEISEIFAFNSPAHFCRTFKQYMGMSPSHYRNCEIRDLESRERTCQQQLEEAYNLLQTVVDETPDLIFFKDVNGVYMGCNAAFCGFVGLSKHQIIGRSDFDIHPKEKAEFFTRHDRPVIRYNRAFKNEETLVFPNGKERLYQVYKAPFHDSQGRITGLVGISRDITDLKRVGAETVSSHFAS